MIQLNYIVVAGTLACLAYFWACFKRSDNNDQEALLKPMYWYRTEFVRKEIEQWKIKNPDKNFIPIDEEDYITRFNTQHLIDRSTFMRRILSLSFSINIIYFHASYTLVLSCIYFSKHYLISVICIQYNKTIRQGVIIETPITNLFSYVLHFILSFLFSFFFSHLLPLQSTITATISFNTTIFYLFHVYSVNITWVHQQY